MTFYSHSKEDKNGYKNGSKKLHTHTLGVRKKSMRSMSQRINFTSDYSILQEIVKLIADFHDLGKYTSFFQDYLLGRKQVSNELKAHASIGAYAAYQMICDRYPELAWISFYLIYSHHSNLKDFFSFGDRFGTRTEKNFSIQKESLFKQLSLIEEDSDIKNLKTYLASPEAKDIRSFFRKRANDETATVEDYFLINYLFSLLIEADKLDASDTFLYTLKELEDHWVDKRFGVPDLSGFENLAGLDNDELRNYCRAEVVNHLQDEDILDQHLFTLTAPTGIGKTMTAFDFALKLKSKLRNKRGHEAQIIYALPFINIIEQAIDEYEKTLEKEDCRILGHYQFADIFGIQDDSADDSYHKKLMTMDTWQSDIVITSFVQFFETVISNRNKLLKKFNHLAGSIIILDEVQTLRLDQMPLIGATLYYLSQFLDTRILMMTATKPKIFELAEEEILGDEGEAVCPKELLTSHEKVFSLFERTAIHPSLKPLTGKKNEKNIQFVEDIFGSKWQTDKSCLIVCNTVNRSINLYDELKKYLKDKGYDNPVFYLSTNIVPTHRMEYISEIKGALEHNKAPILVATQVVEAGVDLDFDMGFRDVGPIDSIIQVAGRINRNNDKSRKHSPLYVIDFGDCKKVYGEMTYQQSKIALDADEEFLESEYLSLVEEYFDNISDPSSFNNSREIFKSMKSLKYDSRKKDEHPISSFKIIQETGLYRPVFIEINEYASKLRQYYLQKIKGIISREEFDRMYKTDFNQHIISVPNFYCDRLNPINEYDDDILVVTLDEVEKNYDPNTGFKREAEPENKFLIL